MAYPRFLSRSASRRYAAPRSFRARFARVIAHSAGQMPRMARALSFAVLLIGLLTGEARADLTTPTSIQSLLSIRATAEQFVRENAPANSGTLIATAGELDARLRLEACAGDLRAFALNGATISARNTVGVRCETGSGWTVYVPVAVECETDVLVLKRDVARGATVVNEDVEPQRRRVAGLGSAYVNKLDVLRDQHLKRAIAAGTVLTNDLFVRNLAVKRGQQVLLVYDARGIAIQAPGLALTDGSMSDRIRVQNQTSLKIVEGVIESGNLVRVGM